MSSTITTGMNASRKAQQPTLPKLLVILGSGGHTTQMLRLVDLLGDAFQYCYAAEHGDELSPSRVKRSGSLFRIHKPNYYGDRWWTIAWKLLRTTAESLWLLLRLRPAAIVSAGPGTAVPMSVLGRLLGTKVVFIESASRVYHPSLSGKLIYPLAHLFFIQWPELQAKYPKAIYAGRLL